MHLLADLSGGFLAQLHVLLLGKQIETGMKSSRLRMTASFSLRIRISCAGVRMALHK
jgi:hypothetical protein